MALNAQTLQGSWNEIKGKIRQRWGQITDQEMQKAHGSVEQLVGVIQRKTGETQSAVEEYLESSIAGGSNLLGTATEAAKDYAHTAVETVRDTTQTAMESVQAGYEEAEEFVQNRPVESVAVAFGAGFIAGAILTCLMHSSRQSEAPKD